jgi:ribosomal protein L18
MNLILFFLTCCMYNHISRSQISISVASMQQSLFCAHIHIISASMSSNIHACSNMNTTKWMLNIHTDKDSLNITYIIKNTYHIWLQITKWTNKHTTMSVSSYILPSPSVTWIFDAWYFHKHVRLGDSAVSKSHILVSVCSQRQGLLESKMVNRVMYDISTFAMHHRILHLLKFHSKAGFSFNKTFTNIKWSLNWWQR